MAAGFRLRDWGSGLRGGIPRLKVVHCVSSSLLGGRLKFTVRRHKFNKDSISLGGVHRSAFRVWRAERLLQGELKQSGLRLMVYGAWVKVEGLGLEPQGFILTLNP